MAVWLDDLSRELLASGELESLITGRHVVGVTTNPTIFASALAKGDRYDGQLSHLAELGASTETAIFTVTTDDVRHRVQTRAGPEERAQVTGPAQCAEKDDERRHRLTSSRSPLQTAEVARPAMPRRRGHPATLPGRRRPRRRRPCLIRKARP